MELHKDPKIKEKIRELGHLLRQRDTTESTTATTSAARLTTAEVEHAVRLLRPNTNTAKQIHDYAAAIRTRLRSSILSQHNTETHNNSISSANKSSIDGRRREGQLQLAKFEKLCDGVRKCNPRLLPSLLMLLQPLSFQEEHMISLHRYEQHHHHNAVDQADNHDAIVNAGVDMAKVVNNAADTLRKEVMMTNQINWNGATTASKSAVSQVRDAEEVVWVNQSTERKLLRDLLFVLQGITGKHIKFDSRSENYVIDPALSLNHTVQDAVLCICELGWLYGRVAAYLKTALSPNATSKGLIVQAFGFAMQEELNDYYRLLAVLEQEMNRIESGSNDEYENPLQASQHGGISGLTILRLKTWMQEPIDRMCLMARLVDDSCGGKVLFGGALISRLHKHTLHGDPSSTSLICRVMDAVCIPFYTTLSRWLLHGELSDPHMEFFIRMNDSSTVRSVWHDTYTIHHSMLPVFISPALANKILIIGKSINFIRTCLQRLPRVATTESSSNEGTIEKESRRKSYRQINKAKVLTIGAKVVDINTNEGNIEKNNIEKKGSLTLKEVLEGIVTTDMRNVLEKLRYGEEPLLRDVVTQLSLGIDTKLVGLMQEHFYFTEHLLALKKFMLLGQGDFVTCLMDAVGPELKKRANQLYRHNLTGILEGALRSSNAQYESNYVLDRVGIRLLEAAAGDSGWEVFSLDYAVDFPLNCVVHLDAIAKYRIAFHMLWRLKRVEWTLASTWKAHNLFSHSHRAEISIELKHVLHRCNLSRATMLHVVNNLCAFLMFEVLETAWLHLDEGLSSAYSLDEVIAVHDNYLNEVLDRALLTQQHEALNLQIQQLLQLILRFCNLEENLIADMLASVARKKLARNAMEERTRMGKWGMDGIDDDDVIGLTNDNNNDNNNDNDGIPSYLIQRIDQTVEEYTKQFDLLMLMLHDQGEAAGEFVRHLTFRLDFNEYFSEKKQYQNENDLNTGTSNDVIPLHTQHPEYHEERYRYQQPPFEEKDERID